MTFTETNPKTSDIGQAKKTATKKDDAAKAKTAAEPPEQDEQKAPQDAPKEASDQPQQQVKAEVPSEKGASRCVSPPVSVILIAIHVVGVAAMLLLHGYYLSSFTAAAVSTDDLLWESSLDPETKIFSVTLRSQTTGEKRHRMEIHPHTFEGWDASLRTTGRNIAQVVDVAMDQAFKRNARHLCPSSPQTLQECGKKTDPAAPSPHPEETVQAPEKSLFDSKTNEKIVALVPSAACQRKIRRTLTNNKKNEEQQDEQKTEESMPLEDVFVVASSTNTGTPHTFLSLEPFGHPHNATIWWRMVKSSPGTVPDLAVTFQHPMNSAVAIDNPDPSFVSTLSPHYDQLNVNQVWHVEEVPTLPVGDGQFPSPLYRFRKDRIEGHVPFESAYERHIAYFEVNNRKYFHTPPEDQPEHSQVANGNKAASTVSAWRPSAWRRHQDAETQTAANPAIEEKMQHRPFDDPCQQFHIVENGLWTDSTKKPRAFKCGTKTRKYRGP